MAINPMQRRARNSFLVGFLISLIIMSAIVVFLVFRMQEVKEEFEAIKAKQTKVYVAGDFMQSGTEVTLDSFEFDTVQTTLNMDELITDEDFEYIDDKTGEIIEKYDKDGNPIKKKMVTKIDLPAGTIITKDMIVEDDNKTTADQRLQEYNMIILPTLLTNGDYIDVRLRLPEGEDYIVVSKKKVIYTTKDTVWLKMNEDEILALGNAIVEAYTLPGSKLYATTYTEAGIQEAATQTYPVSQAVLNLINTNPNIRQEAREGLWQRYNDQQQVEQRNNHINAALSEYYLEMKDSVEEGLQEEITKLQEAREEYVSSLEGTGSIGTE